MINKKIIKKFREFNENFNVDENVTQILKVSEKYTHKVSNIGWNNFDPDVKNGYKFKPKGYWGGLYVHIYFKDKNGEIVKTNDTDLSDVGKIDDEFEKLYIKKRGTIDSVEVSDDFKILRYKTWRAGKESDWVNYTN